MATPRGTWWLLATKFRSPAPYEWEIERSALVAELCVDRVPLVVVTGPAGYGKTTLLAQYRKALAGRNVATAWLTLDEEQRDEIDLAAHLLASLVHASPPLLSPDSIDDWLSGGVAKHLLGRVIAALDQAPGFVTLLVDDFHKAETPGTVRLFDTLLARLPERTQLVIAARHQPTIRLATFVTGGRLRVVSTAELGFSRGEVAAYLQRSGMQGDAALLAGTSEGWPAGLQLLRLIDTGAGSRPLDLKRLSGRQIDVAAYLAEQVLREIEPDLREFLLRTSVLDRIDGDIANTLTEREDGWLVLEELRRRNLFLLALDSEGSWFRYHHIFREFLREQLRRTSPTLAEQLHARAAEGFAKRGLAREAIRHAVASGQTRLLDRIVGDLGGWRFSLYAGTSVWHTLGQLPAQTLLENPHLALSRCYALTQRGRTGEARSLLEEVRPRAVTPDLQLDVAAVDLLLSAYEDRPWTIKSLDEFEKRLRAAPPSEWPLLLSVLDMLIWSHYWAGNFDRAIAAADACLAQCRVMRAHFIDFYGTLGRALALLARGDRTLGRLGLEQAERAASEFFGARSDQAIVARVFRSGVALDELDLDSARALAADAMQVVLAGDSWIDLCISAYSTCATLARIDAGAAVADDLLKGALEGPLAARFPRLTDMLHILRLRNALAGGDVGLAQKIAESPELRNAIAAARSTQDWRLSLPGLLGLAHLQVVLRNAQSFELLADARVAVDAVPVPRYRLELELLEVLGDPDPDEASARFARLLDQARDQGLAILTAEFRPLTSAMPATAGPIDVKLIDEARVARLSRREVETLRLLREGLTGKEIAVRLGISVSTALGYKKSLYRKLRVHRRSQAIAKGFPTG